MKKLWAVVILTQFSTILLFISVLTLSTRAQTNNDQSSFMPLSSTELNYSQLNKLLDKKIADLTKVQTIDYSKVDDIFQDKIKQSPKVKNGINGSQGIQGIQGTQGVQGPQGVPGVSALQKLEIRANPFTNETEWRCTGDLLWTTLLSTPILTGSCS